MLQTENTKDLKSVIHHTYEESGPVEVPVKIKPLTKSILILYGILTLLLILLTTQVKAYEVKAGVSLEGLQPEISDQLPILETAWYANLKGPAAFVITSGTESGVTNRYVDSLHNTGLAIDIRTSTIFKSEVNQVVKVFRLLLGDCYDVVIESDHIHIEYDEQNGRCSTAVQCLPTYHRELLP